MQGIDIMDNNGYEIQEFLGAATLMAYDRGNKLYRLEKIEKLEKFGQTYTAEIRDRGGKFYTVTVEMSRDNRVLDWECHCGYQYSTICKHIVATVLAIRAGEYTEIIPAQPIEVYIDLPALFAQVSKEELANLIGLQCKNNKRLCLELVSALDTKGDQEFVAVQQAVHSIVTENMYKGEIDARGCQKINRDLQHVLKKAARRMEQEKFDKAFAIIQYLLVVTVLLHQKLNEKDPENGNRLSQMLYALSHLTEDCIDAVRYTVSAEERQQYLIPWLKTLENNAFAQQEEIRYLYLRRLIPLVHTATKQQMFDLLDKIQAKHWEEFEDQEEYPKTDQHIRYEIIRQADGHAAAREFINQNLDIEDFRIMAMEEDIQNGDYAHAEQLCLQGEQNGHSRRSLETLRQIYDGWGKKDKLLETLWALIDQGSLYYYDDLKQVLIEKGQWQQKCPVLLEKVKSHCSLETYMYHLMEEEQTEKLMEEVRSHPETVFQYGDWLATDYMEEICAMAVDRIRKEAETASTRRDYQQICKHLDLLIDFGSLDLANDLEEEFRNTYKRKPAFMQELDIWEQYG